MVRSQNRAEAIEISGRRYLDAYKCLNLMSTRPYFEDAFKTCGDFAFSPLDFVFFALAGWENWLGSLCPSGAFLGCIAVWEVRFGLIQFAAPPKQNLHDLQ